MDTEGAFLTWAMITDAEGYVADTIRLENRVSKGKKGGRTIPMHADLHTALVTLQAWRGEEVAHNQPIIFSEGGRGLCRGSTTMVSLALYVAWAGGVLVALRMPHLHHARGAEGCGRRWQSPGRTGTRWSYQPSHDTTLHRGGH